MQFCITVISRLCFCAVPNLSHHHRCVTITYPPSEYNVLFYIYMYSHTTYSLSVLSSIRIHRIHTSIYSVQCTPQCTIHCIYSRPLLSESRCQLRHHLYYQLLRQPDSPVGTHTGPGGTVHYYRHCLVYYSALLYYVLVLL